MPRIIALLCLMLAVAPPAFGLDYATFAPVPLCAPSYETFQPVPINVQPVSAPVQHSGYPVRGNHWTYPGNSRSDIIAHLQSGEHRGKFSRSWLESLSYQQLLSLHDHDHLGQVQWQYVDRSAPALPRRYSPPVQRRSPGAIGGFFQNLFGSPGSSNCPNGRCPTN